MRIGAAVCKLSFDISMGSAIHLPARFEMLRNFILLACLVRTNDSAENQGRLQKKRYFRHFSSLWPISRINWRDV
jgi:hypothetical protein